MVESGAGIISTSDPIAHGGEAPPTGVCWADHADPAVVDAGFLRAHAVADDADAERRARLDCRQRRSPPPRRDRRSHPRTTPGPAHGRTPDARARPGRRG